VSVLLEALKKAAEEKKNLEESVNKDVSKGLELDASPEEASNLKIEDPIEDPVEGVIKDPSLDEATWNSDPLFTIQEDAIEPNEEQTGLVLESGSHPEFNDQLTLPSADDGSSQFSIEETPALDLEDEFIDYEKSPASTPSERIEFEFDDIDAIDIDSVDIADLQKSFSLTQPDEELIESDHTTNMEGADSIEDPFDLGQAIVEEGSAQSELDQELELDAVGVMDPISEAPFEDKSKNDNKKGKHKKKAKKNKKKKDGVSQELGAPFEETGPTLEPQKGSHVSQSSISDDDLSSVLNSEGLTGSSLSSEVDQSLDGLGLESESSFEADALLSTNESTFVDEELTSIIDALDIESSGSEPLGLTKQKDQNSIDLAEDRSGLDVDSPMGMSSDPASRIPVDSPLAMSMESSTGMGMESTPASGMDFQQPSGMSFQQEHTGISFDQAQKAFEDQMVDSNSGFSSVDDLSPTKPSSQSDGFEWSMDDLPGYQSDGESASKSKLADNSDSLSTNPIFVSGANTPPPPKPEGVSSSTKMFVSLVVALFFVLIGFYGIIYYQEQSDDLEQSMMKYNIATLQIKPPVEEKASQPIVEKEPTPQSTDTLVVVPETTVPVETETVVESEAQPIIETEGMPSEPSAPLPDQVEEAEARVTADQASPVVTQPEVEFVEEGIANDGKTEEVSPATEEVQLAKLEDTVLSSSEVVVQPITKPVVDVVRKPVAVVETKPVEPRPRITEKRVEKPVERRITKREALPKKTYEPKVVSRPTPAVREPVQRAKVSPLNSQLPVVKVNKTKSLLAQGYEHYNAGKYQMASYSFKQALGSQPRNVNALMGLGAVETVGRSFVSALGYYEQVLDIEPNNLSALEAIANLSNTVPLNTEWDKELVEMAKVYPRSAILHNASGNAYAKKREWLAAQDSYFKAVVNSPNNPNYMVNLAVSYDHLGKYDLASQYYTQALAYVGIKKVSFDPVQVKARLVSIRQLALKGG